MEKIEERAIELRKLDVSRENAIKILKRDYPKYHDHYYEDITSDWGDEVVDIEPTEPKDPPKEVRVIGFDMPFGDMVIFMVKWAIAAIPAFIILFFIGLIVSLILTAIGIAL